MTGDIKPQEVISIRSNEGSLLIDRNPDSFLNFNMFNPGKRYLVTYQEIDDTLPIPGVAIFTVTRNNGTQEKFYGTGAFEAETPVD
jgi:hypothetical protein